MKGNNVAVNAELLVSQPTRIIKHLDLFSGIGGFALAARNVWRGRYRTIAFCEIDKFAQKVLRKNFGNDIPIIDDIHNLKGDEFGTVDILTGGFPCQPFSQAGRRKGKDDERYLWGEMLRVIRTSKARWVVGENVSGLLQMEYDKIATSLEAEGYEVESFIIPASAVGAPHRRDRIWIVAQNTNGSRNSRRNDGNKRRSECQIQVERSNKPFEQNAADTNNGRQKKQELKATRDKQHNRESTNSNGTGLERSNTRNEEWYKGFKIETSGGIWEKNWMEVATEFCRVDARIPQRVDRLKALGNAIVPQVAEVILAAIKAVDDRQNQT